MSEDTTSTIGPDPFTSKKHKEEIEAKARAEHEAYVASLPDPEVLAQQELAQRRADAHTAAHSDVIGTKIAEYTQVTRDATAALNEALLDPKVGIDELFGLWQAQIMATANERKLSDGGSQVIFNLLMKPDGRNHRSFAEEVLVPALQMRVESHVKANWDVVSKLALDAGNKAQNLITE